MLYANEFEKFDKWMIFWIVLLKVCSADWSANYLWPVWDEVSTEIESKHLETFMAIWHYHNIQMCDRSVDSPFEEGIHQFVGSNLGTELFVIWTAF